MQNQQPGTLKKTVTAAGVSPAILAALGIAQTEGKTEIGYFDAHGQTPMPEAYVVQSPTVYSFDGQTAIKGDIGTGVAGMSDQAAIVTSAHILTRAGIKCTDAHGKTFNVETGVWM